MVAICYTTQVTPHARHSAHHLGLAEGMVTILRGLAINASQGHISLPKELLDKHKLTPRQVSSIALTLINLQFYILRIQSSHLLGRYF